MRLSLALPLLLAIGANAQWDFLQRIIGGPGAAAAKLAHPVKAAVEVEVHNVTLDNFQHLLGDSTSDWLVHFTGSNESCPNCVKYDDAFKSAIISLQDQPLYFGRVSCDADPVLCNMFWTWSAGVLYHIHHVDSPSTSITAPGMPATHHTEVRFVPFHHPDAPVVPVAEDAPAHVKPAPALDSDWVVSVVRDGKWRELEKWEGWSQPFEGWGKLAVRWGWWGMLKWGMVPTWVTMVAISLFGRFVTTRLFPTRPLARTQAAAQPPAAARAVPQ